MNALFAPIVVPIQYQSMSNVVAADEKWTPSPPISLVLTQQGDCCGQDTTHHGLECNLRTRFFCQSLPIWAYHLSLSWSALFTVQVSSEIYNMHNWVNWGETGTNRLKLYSVDGTLYTEHNGPTFGNIWEIDRKGQFISSTTMGIWQTLGCLTTLIKVNYGRCIKTGRPIYFSSTTHISRFWQILKYW